MERPDVILSQRVRSAVDARALLGEDFSGGWSPSDVDLFQKYAAPAPAAEGMLTDFLGVRTSAAFHPFAAHLSGTSSTDIPIPDDGLKAEAIEYFALFTSLDLAPSDSFTVCELGASYAPWACCATLLAGRTGRQRRKAIAVEASGFMFDLIGQHFANNGIGPADAELRFLRGAVSVSKEKLYFPVVGNAGENGGQAVAKVGEVDYVDRSVEYKEVEAFRLPDIIGDDRIDFLHVDIQGAEADVLTANVDLIGRQVGTMFVGTHSRQIEGILMQAFHSAGWRLLRERPVRVAYEAGRPDVVGWTTRDGGQFWINPPVLESGVRPAGKDASSDGVRGLLRFNPFRRSTS